MAHWRFSQLETSMGFLWIFHGIFHGPAMEKKGASQFDAKNLVFFSCNPCQTKTGGESKRSLMVPTFGWWILFFVFFDVWKCEPTTFLLLDGQSIDQVHLQVLELPSEAVERPGQCSFPRCMHDIYIWLHVYIWTLLLCSIQDFQNMDVYIFVLISTPLDLCPYT